MATQMSTRYIGLYYVTIADIGPNFDPVANAQNPHKELIQSIVLTGTKYDIDNNAAFLFCANQLLKPQLQLTLSHTRMRVMSPGP